MILPNIAHLTPHISEAPSSPYVLEGVFTNMQFLLTRDSADRLGYVKPCLLHSKFLPALQGVGTKMSASNENSAIFMTDDAKKIHKKIRSHAFSGGKATQEEHKRLGGDVAVDVAYQYLGFFEDDDSKMERLAKVRADALETRETGSTERRTARRLII